MGPTAILTGASSGIGAAAAAQFVEQGFTVINVSRRDCPIAGVETYSTDLADDTSAKQTCSVLASRLRDAEGPVCLVHNASLMLKDRCDTTEDADLLRVLAVNVIGINVLNRTLLPLMPKGSSVLVRRLHAVRKSGCRRLQLYREQTRPAGHDAGDLPGFDGPRDSHCAHLPGLYGHQHAAPACRP